MVDELDKKMGLVRNEKDQLARIIDEKSKTIGSLEQSLHEHEKLDELAMSLLA